MHEPITTDQLWIAIDKIVVAHGGNTKTCRKSDISLATFSRTRRDKAWPSMKTIAKLLNAHDMSLKEFAQLME